MKKTIKLLIIFAASLVGVIVIAVSGFLIISKNKTYYIYDIRLVEPLEKQRGYIYTDSELEYTSIKSQSVYMNSQANDLLPIAVYSSASSNATDVKITSSNPSVARIVYSGNKCYVRYLKEGTATITATLGSVTDSFILRVFDQVPASFSVYDDAYYGDYAELFPNKLVCYADANTYEYRYNVTNVANTSDNETTNNQLLRVDESSINQDLFSIVSLDTENYNLVLSCKKQDELSGSLVDNATIYLQAYHYNDSGEVVVSGDPFPVSVHVVLYVPEFLQIEVSATPDFLEHYVYTNTTKIDVSALTEEQIIENPSILDLYLSAEKAEKYLSENEEFATYNAYLTERVTKLYLRFRKVYTNGDIVYLKNGENVNLTFSDDAYIRLDPTGDYYIMELDNTGYFSTNTSFDIQVDLTDYVVDSNVFKFEYFEQTQANAEKFYTRNEDGVYEFNYWDERCHFINEVYDRDGNIIAFGD